MAKNTGKSQAIRDLLKTNPRMKAKAVVEALAQKGLRVSNNLVYLVKAKMGRGRRKAARAKAASLNGADPLALLRDVRALADRVGGFEKLQELVALMGPRVGNG